MAESNPTERNAPFCNKMKEKMNKSFGGESRGDKRLYIFEFPSTSYNRYLPRVLSIGPYYRRHPHLQEMEKFKWQCLVYSLKKSQKNLEDYVEKICPLEQEVKECYPESSLQTDEFLEMMVLDGFFIVEFIRFSCSVRREEKPEQSIMKRHPLWGMERANEPKIYADLLLLQNQIPYKVLEQAFEVSKLEGETQSLSTLSVEFFSAILGFHYPPYRNGPEVDWMHLLDLVRSIFIPSYYREWPRGAIVGRQLPPRYQNKSFHFIPCITKLRGKGIEVRPRQNDGLVVNIDRGVIEMPKIILNDLMCSFLENCVTFEQRHNNRSKHLSLYALCSGCLVNTASDVEYLRERGVIENQLKTDEEAADFFDNLGKGLTWDHDDFFMFCYDVNDYCENTCHRHWASFEGKHFDKPINEKCGKMNEKISQINKSLGGESQGDKSPYIFDRTLLKDRFRPRVVSIGPCYRGHRSLDSMEKFKWQCLAYSVNKSKKKLEDYLEKIWALDQFRECYSESSGLQPHEFLEMMVLDGCFILEFIRFSYSSSRQEKPEQSAMKSHPLARVERANIPKIRADLLMIQNQIPYKVLEEVFEVSNINLVDESQSLFTLSVEVFSPILGFHYPPKRRPSEVDRMHLLDLVRLIFIKSNSAKEMSIRIQMPQRYQRKPFQSIPCVTELRRDGIKVRPRLEDGLVVNFRHGAIEIPKIFLDDLMCSFLENCVRLEQHHNDRSKNFSVYALCMDCLVNTASDVEYLCKKKVIENRLKTHEDAAKFFNNLGNGLTIDSNDDDFFTLCSEVRAYCERNQCLPHWTKFRREYFNKPWLWASGLIAFGILCLQTFYTVFAYHVPPKN